MHINSSISATIIQPRLIDFQQLFFMVACLKSSIPSLLHDMTEHPSDFAIFTESSVDSLS